MTPPGGAGPHGPYGTVGSGRVRGVDADRLVVVRDRMLVTFRGLAWTAPRVLGVVLVGSGVDGFTDAWSDLDVVVATEPVDQAAVVDHASGLLRHSGAVLLTRWHHRHGVDVVCALLESGLEVDVGVWSTELLFASSPRWRLLSARDDAAAELVTRAMTENPALPRESPAEPSGDDPLWQEVVAASVARRRDARLPDRADLRVRIGTSTYSDRQRTVLRALVDDR